MIRCYRGISIFFVLLGPQNNKNRAKNPTTYSFGANMMAAAVAVKTGIIQQMTSMNQLAIESHIRRVCTPLDRVGRGSRPRQLHISHYGYLCPVETQEGPACGLLKAFSLGSRVTHAPSPTQNKELRAAMCSVLPDQAPLHSHRHLVFFNGEILGSVDEAEAYVRAAWDARPAFFHGPHFALSIYIGSSGHIHIHSDEGRVVRPLLSWPLDPALDYGTLGIDELMQRRALRYVDAAEAWTLHIQVDPTKAADDDDTDRMEDVAEIHALLMLGITAACIPFLQCNQSPHLWQFGC